MVRKASEKYGVDESLILAIMQTESSFNPYAVSGSDALGLMQVMQHTAGKDVFQMRGKWGTPSRSYLFDPENNIDTGTAYGDPAEQLPGRHSEPDLAPLCGDHRLQRRRRQRAAGVLQRQNARGGHHQRHAAGRRVSDADHQAPGRRVAPLSGESEYRAEELPQGNAFRVDK